MLNVDKYKCEILQLIEHDMNFAFNVNTNRVTSCVLQECDDCLFKDAGKTCSFFRTKWLLSEYKEPILDEVEREYLSAVCRPYKVVSIIKRNTQECKLEWIGIDVYIDYCEYLQHIRLPFFKEGTMYKGMELGKKYTPQELGITCKNNPKGEIKHEWNK